MSSVSNDLAANPLATGSTGLPKQAVNVSDATQMENNFISLMVAQIKYQDPTNPVDSTEFLNQFSAMSQVKSMENMASLSQSNLVLMDNLQTLTAAGLVGQQVTVAVESLDISDQAVQGQFQLKHASASTTLQLTDANGAKTEIKLGPRAAGSVPFEVDPRALGLAPGRYDVEIKTESGEFPQVEVAGLVSHVRVSAEGPVLDVKGAGSVPFYKILEFGRSDGAVI